MNEVSREPKSSEASVSSRGALPSADSGSRLIVIVVGILAIALVVFSVWYFAIHDRGPKDDLGRMQGLWKVQRPGEPEKEGETSVTNGVRIDGDQWTFVSGGQERTTWRLTLNAAAREIDLTRLGADGQPARFSRGPRKGVEERMLGVYSFDGDTFKVTLAPEAEGRPKSQDGEVPTLTLGRVQP